jgi:hypothetical protein
MKKLKYKDEIIFFSIIVGAFVLLILIKVFFVKG